MLKKILLGLALSSFVFAVACGGGDDCNATTEICDGLDNDCNGFIDDGLQRVCQTACGVGVETCEAGSWIGCDARQPTEEICNGKDDDCDGCFDEKGGADCQPMERQCTTACGNGVEYCYNGSWMNCDAQVPVAETCNNLDDDCDGLTDEELDVDGDSDGHYSVDSCSTPNDDCNDTDNTIYGGAEELCDGKDNNCNQQIDEGCNCTPNDTQPCGANIGECAVGTQTCLGGAWAPCLDGGGNEVAMVGQNPELCNGLDDDCDGSTDENNPEGGAQCGTAEGQCSFGIMMCIDDGGVKTLACGGPNFVGSVDEECDGLDNDCDGFTDEELNEGGLDYDGVANDSCGTIQLLADMAESTPLSMEKTLYPIGDQDWYHITAIEDVSHGIYVGTQCFTQWVLLYLPPGASPADWELCIEPAENCSSFENSAWCTDPAVDYVEFTDGSSAYLMGYYFEGLAPLEDSTELNVVVRSVNDSVEECMPYRLEMYMQWEENAGCD